VLSGLRYLYYVLHRRTERLGVRVQAQFAETVVFLVLITWYMDVGMIAIIATGDSGHGLPFGVSPKSLIVVSVAVFVGAAIYWEARGRRVFVPRIYDEFDGPGGTGMSRPNWLLTLLLPFIVFFGLLSVIILWRRH
jgi:hypothetical protein